MAGWNTPARNAAINKRPCEVLFCVRGANFDDAAAERPTVTMRPARDADPTTTVTFTAGANSQAGNCVVSLSGQQVSLP
jgi:hypothetical protein